MANGNGASKAFKLSDLGDGDDRGRTLRWRHPATDDRCGGRGNTCNERLRHIESLTYVYRLSMRDVCPFVKEFIDKRYHLSTFDDHDALSLPAVSVDYAQSIGPNAAEQPVLKRSVLKTAN
ncbi:MAG: hypothetical protein BVN33_08755 [Proteobacteria bacterium ST_bin13]|nr:MAG: hypothetical protein BVN33_08755 [Proteobacteria bacterium ST_bin13]